MESQNKYHNSKIYQITDIGYNKCYIGSTTENLCMRMARHRSRYKSFLRDDKEGRLRSFEIFNEFGVENCKIELIEYFKCDTLAELLRREGEVIKNTECVNKVVAGRTKKEYREDNRLKIKENDKLYYAENKEQRAEYYKRNKERVKEFYKEYYENNKDKILADKREYREANKDRINARKRELRKLKKEMKDNVI